MNPNYHVDIYDWSNHITLTPEEQADLYRKMSDYNDDGVADMIKIVNKHELYLKVSPPTSEALLALFHAFRPITHREIAAYIAVTPQNRKSCKIYNRIRRHPVEKNKFVVDLLDYDDLRLKIAEFNENGIRDMKQIINECQENVELEVCTAECLLSHLDQLQPTTLFDIKAYIDRRRREVNHGV